MSDIEQIWGDSAYSRGDMVAKLEASDHTHAVKPWPIRRNLPRRVTTDDHSTPTP